MSVCKKTPLEGKLDCTHADFDVPDILLSVCETKTTGLLTFSTTEAEKTLFVREGSYVFAKSSSMDDRLGEYLLRNERVALRDLVSLSKMVKPGKRLGALLVESGALDPKELVQSVVGQVRSIALSLFRWTKAEYRFVEQDLPSKETITLNMPTAQLIVDGIRGINSWWRIEQAIGELDSMYRAVSGMEGALRSLELDTAALELLAMLNRPKRIGDTCTDSSLTEMEVCKLLWAFRSLGWVDSVEDDGTALIDNWQLGEEPAEVVPRSPDISVPAEPAVPVEPVESVEPVHADAPVAAGQLMPAVVEPISEDESHEERPRFSEDDTQIIFAQESDQPFPSAGEQPVADTAPPVEVDSVEAPPATREVDSQPPTLDADMDMDMDMDMEGLSEALKGDSSK